MASSTSARREASGVARKAIRLSPAKEIALFSQLARLLESGISPIEALALVSQHCGPATASALRSVVEQIESGKSMAQAATAADDLFPPHAAALLGASEQVGALPAAFRAMAAAAELRLDIRRQLVRALVYPCVLFTLVFFVPQVHLILSAGWVTYLEATLVPYLIALVVLFLLAFAMPRLLIKALGQGPYAALLYQLPVLGSILRLMGRVRFSSHLATGIGAGLNTYQSLRLAAQASGDPRWNTKLALAERSLNQGATLHDALIRTGLLDEGLLLTIAAAERAGTLSDSLEREAEQGQRTLAHRITLALQLVSVVLLLGTYAFVAGRVVTQFRGVQDVSLGKLDGVLKEAGGGAASKEIESLQRLLRGQGGGQVDLEALIKKFKNPLGYDQLPQDVKDALK
jgi:type II secretory pathway component PulF